MSKETEEATIVVGTIAAAVFVIITVIGVLGFIIRALSVNYAPDWFLQL